MPPITFYNHSPQKSGGMGQGQRETPKMKHGRKNSHLSQEHFHLNYLYMNTRAMGYKQSELHIHGQLQSFDLSGITEKQWDSLQDRSAAINGPLGRHFSKDIPGRQKGDMFLHTKG